MGMICGGAWERLSGMMGGIAGKPQTKTVKGKAKCPKCGEEFEVDFKVDQRVSGSILDFKVSPGGGLLDLCPFKEKGGL